MRSFGVVSLLLLFSLVVSTYGDGHQYVGWHSPSGKQITYFSASWVVPPHPKKATYYVWPGVQDGTGVLQSVMDGRNNDWWLGSGWCCGNPSLAWGSGGNVYQGQTAFGTLWNGGNAWYTDTGRPSWAGSAADFGQNSWALTYKNFNFALFDVETYGTNWDFGPITITWLEVKSNAPQPNWCGSSLATYGSIGYSVGSVSGYTFNGGSGCLYNNLKIWNTGPAAHTPQLSEFVSNFTRPAATPVPPPTVLPEPNFETPIDIKDLPPH